MNGYLVDALAIGLTDNVGKHAMIGIGMWFGLIMAFNVWFIIWPNQQKVIGLVEASDEEKPKAARAAALAFPDQHHAVDPHALCHGGGAEHLLGLSALKRKTGPFGPVFFYITALAGASSDYFH